MTRLEKKCLIFSLCLHGTVAVILIFGSGFRTAPPPRSDLQIITLLSPNILDRAGSGGGTPTVSQTAQSQPKAQPQRAQPAPPQPRPTPTPVQQEQTEHVERAALPTPHQPREIKETKRPDPDETDVVSLERAPKPPKHTRHQVQVDYTPASSNTKVKRTAKPVKTTEYAEAESSSRAEARRLREIQNSLDGLASGVRNSGSPNTIVDVVGIGGGEAFTGYRDAIFSAYYNAWVTPDALASRSAFVDARVTIARDGSIVSAEVVRASDDRTLDRSVEQALRRVDKLPPFPATSHDTQRTFTLRFSPQAKEMSG